MSESTDTTKPTQQFGSIRGVSSPKEMHRQNDQLRQQRDELLGACRLAHQALVDMTHIDEHGVRKGSPQTNDFDSELGIIEQAIANATTSKQQGESP